MKYISHIVSFVLGGAVTAGGLVMLAPPSKLDLGIDIGRKLGLVAAEARYAEYETGHAVLLVQVEEAEQRTEAAESSLKEFRASSGAEVRRLKKIEQEATLAQKQAAQEQPELAETVDLSFESLEIVTATADQETQDAVADAKMASRELYDNCLVQLHAANKGGGALRLQLGIKEEEVLVLSTSLESWKSLAETEKRLREDAESYISDVKDSGFYFGVGALAGVVKTISGNPGPGVGVGVTVGWRF